MLIRIASNFIQKKENYEINNTNKGLLSATNAKSEHSTQAHWSYNGKGAPTNWGNLSPEFQTCGNGVNQSPIDLKKFIDANLTEIPFDYNSTSTDILNNGHTSSKYCHRFDD